MREAKMAETTLTENQRRADIARKLAAIAVCPQTKALFHLLQERWSENQLPDDATAA
jgi:hypothetical protein